MYMGPKKIGVYPLVLNFFLGMYILYIIAGRFSNFVFYRVPEKFDIFKILILLVLPNNGFVYTK